jgi:hypothetical protein
MFIVAEHVHKPFNFKVTEDGTDHSLAAMSSMNVDDLDILTKIKEGEGLGDQAGIAKKFLCTHVPNLEAEMDAAGYGNMVYLQILDAYLEDQQPESGES